MDEKLILEFAESLLHAIGACQDSFEKTETPSADVERLHSLFVEIIDQNKNLVFSEFHNHLLVNDNALTVNAQQVPTVGAFLFFMLKFNIRSITITNLCSLGEFDDLVRIFSIPPPRLKENPTLTLKRHNIVNVIIEPQGEPGKSISHKATAKPSPAMPLAKPWKEGRSAEKETAANLAEEYLKSLPDNIEDPDTDISKGGINIATISKEKKRKKRKKSHLADKPEGTVYLKVMVKLGRQVVDGAKVIVMSKPPASKLTKDREGTYFLLSPGKYRIIIQHDKYTMNHVIELFANLDEIQIDINLLDA